MKSSFHGFPEEQFGGTAFSGLIRGNPRQRGSPSASCTSNGYFTAIS
jgi:hypothetical protein